jgi:hypothetical protein
MATQTEPERALNSAAHVTITMESPGHWHFSKSKHLLFHVKDSEGNGVPGLAPQVKVRTLSGGADVLTVTDGGDGTYAARYTAFEFGSGYATSYSVLCTVTISGATYAEAWPFEVVRDGREDITKADGRYSYQVRYGWVPGRPVANLEKPVTFYFEPRRSLNEGAEIDTKQPWRAASDHVQGVSASVLVVSADGLVKDEIQAAYGGLGIYTAARIFSPAEVGAGREYLVSLMLTDPYNAEAIGAGDNAYPLQVTGA